MTPLFDKNKHRLSEGEKELLWRRITHPRERVRRRPWFWRLAISSGFVLATLVVVIQMQDPLSEVPEEPLLFGRGARELVPVEKKGDVGDVPVQGIELGARPEPITAEKAAAPAQPDATLSVAPPSSGGREPAAVREKGVSDVKAEGTAAETDEHMRGGRGKVGTYTEEELAHFRFLNECRRTGEYAHIRRQILEGNLPSQGQVQISNYIRAFDTGYPEYSGESFSVRLDGIPSLFNPSHMFLRVGLQGREPRGKERVGGTILDHEGGRILIEFNKSRVQAYEAFGWGKMSEGRFNVKVGEPWVWLYEIQLTPKGIADFAQERKVRSGSLGSLDLYYRIYKDRDQVLEREVFISMSAFAASFNEADPYLRLAVLVAEFAECLTSEDCTRVQSLIAPAKEVAAELPDDERAAEFVEILQRTVEIQQAAH